jgi:hypothetical protein
MKERAEKVQGMTKKRNKEKTKQKRSTVLIQMLVHRYL